MLVIFLILLTMLVIFLILLKMIIFLNNIV